ncbi:MAG: hypothetical protein M3P06_16090 [Acidobacteriota bacterium]|nr:hypothetical protein [Acidobacteriota bacterium]
MSDADRAFLGASLKTWEVVRADALLLAPAPLPAFILFDEKCVWRDGKGTAHEGTIALPDGNEVPAAVMAFAGSHEEKAFLVMALPVMWRAEKRHRENPRLDLLLRVVFVHEMTHTRQAGSFGGRIGELEAQHKLEDLNDDIVQQRFAEREGFKAAFVKERDLLYAIANESDADRRRALAKEALSAIRERRARYFRGDDAFFAELEEIFLGMEGVANWAGFRAAMHAGLPRDEAITLMQGSRKWFSQDEGLALFLAIDALTPGWQKRVFRDKAEGAFDLLD